MCKQTLKDVDHTKEISQLKKEIKLLNKKIDQNRKQLEILNYATKKALKDVDKQRGESPPDFIKEFYKWCSLVKKYIKERLN